MNSSRLLTALMPMHAALAASATSDKSAPSEKSDSWIRVDRQLPDADLVVIIYSPDANDPIWFGAWDGERWCSITGKPLRSTVTHWMHFPEPPQ